MTSADAESMFNEEIRNHYFQTLDSAAHYIQKLDTLATLEQNKAYFLKSREWYKRAEPMIMAYDYQNYLSMNAPNLLKVEIDDYTDIKKLNPQSYQVLEELLYADEKVPNMDLHLVINYLQARIPYIRKNHIIYTQRDRHHLKMIRDAIVNIATKGITGFDSPMLANSLNEAIYNYESIHKVLNIYKEAFKDQALYEQWSNEIDRTINSLQSSNFDDFDRYGFIKDHTNKQLELINQTADDWGIALNTSRSLNTTATNLFDKDFFNIKQFSLQGSPDMSDERILLGKKLFNDPALSSTGTISCATCHLEDKAFTDGHKKGLGINGVELQRNTPTLTYAVFQQSFFYDGRAAGLESQIVNVVNDENEFHSDLNTIERKVKENASYKPSFEELYDGEISNQNVRHAIATYIRSLAPFDSKFDRNMQGQENSLTSDEKLGFNLFMGKAACATCHFPPAFNGTVPPKYLETEFENLGVPKNADFENPVLDDDPGQYHPYKVEEKRNFFKTTTVRNIALTAPYMHNGVYETLEEVITFYNVGGGQGMGLDVPYQTLPPDSLNLSDREQRALISFMHSLTDKRFEKVGE
ncbi:methylamine utilization protein [Muricauda oceani]|uniref:Methylamine utilization protein n=1 Tax=Flagellimonas oceani TaxID=2698672 RepID=A0A6G7J1L7_9FLAO|nr:cytochrome c peroxidase [Allomuricauda oceani]MBW8241552.1 methylamine utilization protein [Allomuricauda oceani]QII44454.1 methylamine utilization protein [Allomuricauda oceani]